MADYSNYGLLIDYKYCDNCGSCVVACQEEKGLAADQYGIKVFEKGPWKKDDATMEDGWDWDYIPVPTDRCDRCARRQAAGKAPSCVQHCQAGCLYYGTLEELAEKMDLGKKKLALFS